MNRLMHRPCTIHYLSLDTGGSQVPIIESFPVVRIYYLHLHFSIPQKTKFVIIVANFETQVNVVDSE